MTEKSTGGPDGGTARLDNTDHHHSDLSGINTPNEKSSQPATAARERLPNRRASEVFQFWDCYTATVSRFPDGRLAEIFLDHVRTNSQLAEHAATAAILASMLLQLGVSPAAIRHSIAGPLATALEIAEREQP